MEVCNNGRENMKEKAMEYFGEELPEAIEKAADVERALNVVIHYEQ